jgi:hypothetical protein
VLAMSGTRVRVSHNMIAKLLLGVRSEALRVFGRKSSETDSERVSYQNQNQIQIQIQIQKTASVIRFRTIKSEKTLIRVREGRNV